MTGARHRAAGRGPGARLVRVLRRAADAIALRGADLAHRRRSRIRGRALIGVDVSTRARQLPRHSFGPLWLALLAGLLCLAALRIDVLRMRYALADALAQKQQLSEEQRQLTVEMRKLRDPGLLAERARELGFQRAEHLVDLGASEEPAERGPRSEPPPVAAPPAPATSIAAAFPSPEAPGARP